MHRDLHLARKLVYDPNGLHLTNVIKEEESAEYGAFDFDLGSQHCKFRVGKITPKKAGFFFTIWKRIGDGPIMPYDLADPIDLFIFSVRTEEHFGQFIFPKAVLCKKGVVSKEGKGGKRAMRVYAPWVTVDSKQALATQAWQSNYYLEITNSLDLSRLRQLLS